MRHGKISFASKREDGVAVIITLLFLIALSVLAMGLVFSTGNEMKAGASYKYSQQAFYVANAGIQKAVTWFNNNYTPHVPASDYNTTVYPIKFGTTDVLLAGQSGSTSVYPESTVITTFTNALRNQALQADTGNSGSFSVDASLLKYQEGTFINLADFTSYTSAMERWSISSVGYWGPAANPLGTAVITATIENSGNSLFDKALWGIVSADLGGTTLIDSYNPLLGPYDPTSNSGQQAGIGSNGQISNNGRVTIMGGVQFGPAGSFSATSNVTVTGTIEQLSQPKAFPPIAPFNVGSGTVNVRNNLPAGTTINPGQFGKVSVGPNANLILNPGVYYFDELNEGSSGQVTITGPTTIYIKNSMDLSGQGVVNNTGDPTKCTVIYSGTSEAKLAGGPAAFYEVYAPNADVKLTGNLDFYGSFIGKTLTIQGNPKIHFDSDSLKQHLVPRPFRVVTWSQNIY